MNTYSYSGVQSWGPSPWPISNEALREYCDKNYHQILPIITEKVHQEKLKGVKVRLNFEEASRHSESGTPSRRRNLKERLGPRRACSMSGSSEPRHGRSKSPREKDLKRRTVFKRLEKGVFHMLGDKEKNLSAHSRDSRHRSYYSSRRDTESCYQSSRSRETEIASKKHRHKRESSQRTEALSENPFTPRIRYFDFPKSRMPSHIKTYDGSEDPEDHLKIFQAAAKTERWAMPTWCHMFNSTLTENVKSVDEMMMVTKAFLRGEVAASNRKRKKLFPSWKKQEVGQKQNFKKGKQRTERKQDRFTLLTKTPKEIIALDKGKFKPPPPMTTPVEKRNASKFCEFHGEVGDDV
ncbi:hypothetical protein Tco_0624208 [Tanacetum coccineum]|uniref:Reverse transcriptase domain-containing protein n=1 Tax=Tanacetum coccineum TaxID=301880 RepID=A0ABQ4WDA5_9ASTR